MPGRREFLSKGAAITALGLLGATGISETAQSKHFRSVHVVGTPEEPDDINNCNNKDPACCCNTVPACGGPGCGS